MSFKEPYELTPTQCENIRIRFPMVGGTLAWEFYHAARSRGLSVRDSYDEMLANRNEVIKHDTK